MLTEQFQREDVCGWRWRWQHQFVVQRPQSNFPRPPTPTNYSRPPLKQRSGHADRAGEKPKPNQRLGNVTLEPKIRSRQTQVFTGGGSRLLSPGMNKSVISVLHAFSLGQISLWKSTTEPSYSNERYDSVSRKPLDGFQNAFNTK